MFNRHDGIFQGASLFVQAGVKTDKIFLKLGIKLDHVSKSRGFRHLQNPNAANALTCMVIAVQKGNHIRIALRVSRGGDPQQRAAGVISGEDAQPLLVFVEGGYFAICDQELFLNNRVRDNL